MWKGIIALIVTIIVLTPFIISINQVNQTEGYIAKTSYRFIPPQERHVVYSSAEKLDKLVNFYARILIILAAIATLLLTVVEYLKFCKIYREERG